MRLLLHTNILIMILLSIIFTGCQAKEILSNDGEARVIKEEQVIEKIEDITGIVEGIKPDQQENPIESEEAKEVSITFMGM